MTIADELRQLQELYDRGELTVEQFEQAKAVVLNRESNAQSASDEEFLVDPDEVLSSQALLTMRIIAAAMLMGVLFFFGIVVVLTQHKDKVPAAPQGGLPMISLVALMMFATSAPLSFVLPAIMTRAALREIVARTGNASLGGKPGVPINLGAKLMSVRQTTMIVGMALLEGVGFLGSIAYMIEGSPLAFGVVIVVIVLMAAKFPTARKICAWLEQQSQALTEMRQLNELSGER